MTARTAGFAELHGPDLARRLEGMVRIGTVEELDEAAARVRVRVGEMLTNWLPWGVQRAGADADWHCPEPGEQVLIVAPDGELAQAVAVCSLYQDKHPAPASTREKRRRQWRDGAFEEYDREAHHYTLNVPAGGRLTIRCGVNELVLDDSGLLIRAVAVRGARA